MNNFGYEEGELCWRNGCHGVIAQGKTEGCSCFISSPCSACMTPKEYCPSCDWRSRDEDDTFNDCVVKYAPDKWTIEKWQPRPLDPRRLDYHSKSHSNSSMIKEGVYPNGMTSKEVEEKVRGTFGGRFESFGDGKFRYIAYTD